MSLTFTLLSAEDAERLRGLVERWHLAEGLGFDGPAARHYLHRLLGNDRSGHVWTIGSEGSDIGYAILTFGAPGSPSEPKAYVSALYLVPEWRGKGLGRRTQLFLADVARWLKVRLFAFEIESERKHVRVFARPFRRSNPGTVYLRGAVA
jgi:GNAT superfamily N-acetyltransferase